MLNKKDIKIQWDLSPLLKDESADTVDRAITAIKTQCEDFIIKWEARTDYLEDPKVLAQALREMDVMDSKGSASGDVGYYFSLKQNLDQENTEIKKNVAKIVQVATELENKLQFFTHRLAKIPAQTQKLFLESADLSEYKHWLEVLFENAKYLLSESEEKIVNLYSPMAFSNWVNMTSEFLGLETREALTEDGTTAALNLNELLSHLASSNPNVRQSVTSALNDIFSKHLKTGEAELNSVLANYQITDKLRGFTRPDAHRHISDDLDSKIVDALLDAVTSNYDVVHRYYKIKAKLLGLPKLTYFERNILYKGLDKKFKFDEALDIVDSTFGKLDGFFSETLNNYLTKGQIDVFPKKSKSHMEFCASGDKDQPVYVLLNFGEKLDDVSTLAHEMGHAINDELVKRSQNTFNSDIPTCLAETASTFFEDFALDTVETTLSDEEKLALLVFRLDAGINTVFRQIACYKFELDLHTAYRANNFLSKEEIGQLFVKNMSAYCGEFVEMPEGSQNWWLHWPHIRSAFYVYTYAFGYLVSKNLQALVKNNSDQIQNVKKFLSAGSHKRPNEILLDIGIDISKPEFWGQGVDQLRKQVDHLEDVATRLKKL